MRQSRFLMSVRIETIGAIVSAGSLASKPGNLQGGVVEEGVGGCLAACRIHVMGKRALLQKFTVFPQRYHLLAHVAHSLCLPAHEDGSGRGIPQGAFLWRGERTP